MVGQVRLHGTQKEEEFQGAADVEVSKKKNKKTSAPTDFTHRRRRTVSALR